MRINFTEIVEETKGWIDLRDITTRIETVVEREGMQQGFALIYAVEPETAVITLEAEMALILDMADFIKKLVGDIKMEARGDVASALLGTHLAVPVLEGCLDLGTWQQIMLVDLGQAGKKKVLLQLVS